MGTAVTVVLIFLVVGAVASSIGWAVVQQQASHRRAQRAKKRSAAFVNSSRKDSETPIRANLAGHPAGADKPATAEEGIISQEEYHDSVGEGPNFPSKGASVDPERLLTDDSPGPKPQLSEELLENFTISDQVKFDQHMKKQPMPKGTRAGLGGIASSMLPKMEMRQPSRQLGLQVNLAYDALRPLKTRKPTQPVWFGGSSHYDQQLYGTN